MTIVDDSCHLYKDSASICFAETSNTSKSIEKLSSFAKIEYEKKIILILKGLIYFDDLRMVQSG